MNELSQWLKFEFERRKALNQKYSLRAFARHLGVSSGHLSEVLSGKKTFRPASAIRMAESLDIPKFLKEKLLASEEGSAGEFVTPVPTPPAPLPGGFSSRLLQHQGFEQLQSRLCLHGTATMNIHGEVGLGKTSLALALATDLQVRKAFPAGIVWLDVQAIRADESAQAALCRSLGWDCGRADLATERGQERALTKRFEHWNGLFVLNRVRPVDSGFLSFLQQLPAQKLLVSETPLLADSWNHAIHPLSPSEGLDLLAAFFSAALHAQGIPVPRSATGEALERLVAFSQGNLGFLVALGKAVPRALSTGAPASCWDRLLQALEDAPLAGQLGISEAMERFCACKLHASQVTELLSDGDSWERGSLPNSVHALRLFAALPNTFDEEAAYFVADCTRRRLEDLTQKGFLRQVGPQTWGMPLTLHWALRSHPIPDWSRKSFVAHYAFLAERVHAPHVLRNLVRALEAAVDTLDSSAALPLFRAALRGRADLEKNGLLRRCRSLAEEKGDAVLGAACSCLEGQLLDRSGLTEQAIVKLLEADEAARQQEAWGLLTDIRTSLLYLLCMNGRLDQARALAEDSLRHTERPLSEHAKAGFLFAVGSTWFRAGQEDRGRECLTRAAALFEKSCDSFKLAATRLMLIGLTMEEGHLVEAIALCEETRTICQNHGLAALEARILGNQVHCHYVLGQFLEAEEGVRLLLEKARAQDMLADEIDGLLSLSYIQSERGQGEAAVASATLARELSLRRQDSSAAAHAEIALALAQSELGRHLQAEAHLEAALPYVSRLPPVARAINMLNFAQVRMKAGRMSDARAALCADDVPSDYGMYWDQHRAIFSEILLGEGRSSEALALSEQQEEIMARQGKPWQESSARWVSARALDSLGRHTEAVRRATDACAFFSKNGHHTAERVKEFLAGLNRQGVSTETSNPACSPNPLGP